MDKLYVGNLNWDTDEDTLKAHFEQIGEVKEVIIIRYPDTHKSKGFGFVTMANDELAQEAIDQLDGSELEGRELKVDMAKPKN